MSAVVFTAMCLQRMQSDLHLQIRIRVRVQWHADPYKVHA